MAAARVVVALTRALPHIRNVDKIAEDGGGGAAAVAAPTGGRRRCGHGSASSGGVDISNQVG